MFVNRSSTKSGWDDISPVGELEGLSAAVLGNSYRAQSCLCFFHSGSETSTFSFVSLTLVIIQLAQTSRFFCSGIGLYLDGSC